MPALIPTVYWAQRKDKLFLTVDVQDVKDAKTDLLDNKFTFSGVGGSDAQEYALELEFNGPIVVADSKVSVSARHIFLVVVKQEEGHWPRLTKERQGTHIKCDWDKWVDEDDEDETPEKVDTSGMNFSGFGGGGGGPPGMGGMMGGGMGGMGGMMGGGGGMGGMGGMDMASLMAQMGGGMGGGGMGNFDMGGEDEGEGEDSDNEEGGEEALPDLVK